MASDPTPPFKIMHAAGRWYVTDVDDNIVAEFATEEDASAYVAWRNEDEGL